MKYIYIGKIVNTHGIKGEVRIISKFKYKEKVFKKDMIIYIGSNKDKEIIRTYRPHKNYDMITMSEYDNINQILKYKGQNVYIDKSDLNLDSNEYLDSDLTNIDVIVDDQIVGRVKQIERYEKNNLIIVNNGVKDFLIPFVHDIILNVDLKKRIITVKNIKGLFD